MLQILDTSFGGLLSYTAMEPPCNVACYSGNVYYVGGTLHDHLCILKCVHVCACLCTCMSALPAIVNVHNYVVVTAPLALTALLPAVGALIHPDVIFQHSPYLEEDVPSKDFLWSSRRVSPVHVEVVGGLQLPGRACHVDSISGEDG